MDEEVEALHEEMLEKEDKLKKQIEAVRSKSKSMSPSELRAKYDDFDEGLSRLKVPRLLQSSTLQSDDR